MIVQNINAFFDQWKEIGQLINYVKVLQQS